ncbi:site-specific DNA-methyltransferase, partial [Phocaeicola vulgatus]|nr:site-specific DNA-methyltransferase [Phocaeicola vulgatus]
TSTISASEHKLGKHPTQKPKLLLQHFIEILSNEKDVVLDPFMGSGSTGVVCELLNRNFIGFELDEKYYNIATQRILEKK